MSRRRPTNRSNGPGGLGKNKGGSNKAKGGVQMGRRKEVLTLAANTGRQQGRGEKDGRMAAARQAATNKAVSKAGGTGAYLKQAKAAKSRLVKVGDKYVNKNTPYGKAAIKKNNKKR